MVSSAPVTRKFPTPPEPPKSKTQQGPRPLRPPSFLSNVMKKAPSEPEVNTANEQNEGAPNAASKKSFSPRFAKKVSRLAAAGDGDSDSDDDRALLQKQQQQEKGKKGKKSSFRVKFPLAADSRAQKSVTPRMVPVKGEGGSSLSLQHSSPVRYQLPRSPRESRSSPPCAQPFTACRYRCQSSTQLADNLHVSDSIHSVTWVTWNVHNQDNLLSY